MNPAEKLQLLDALEEQAASRRRRANWVAWGSVVGALVALAILIETEGRRLMRIEAQVTAKTAELDAKQRELTTKQQRLDDVEAALAGEEKKLAGLQEVFGGLSEPARTSLVNKALDEKPQVATVLPRIYMHIVDAGDRTLAESLAERLRAGGYLVVGIQLIPSARTLKQSDVRFYRKTEEPEAAQIAKILQDAGENVRTNHLAQFENSTTARPNHFEVWLAKHSAA